VCGNPLGVRPHFRINSRIGVCDQFLYVMRSAVESQRINWGVCPDPVFQLSPTYFHLSINHVSLVTYAALGVCQPLIFDSYERWRWTGSDGPAMCEGRLDSGNPANECARWRLWPKFGDLFARPRRNGELQLGAFGSGGYCRPLRSQIYQSVNTRLAEVTGPQTEPGGEDLPDPWALRVEAARLLGRIRLHVAQAFRRERVPGTRWVHRANAALAQVMLDAANGLTVSELRESELDFVNSRISSGRLSRADRRRLASAGLLDL
jgi:hypothetical protein